MSDRRPLTLRQRQILWLMKEHAPEGLTLFRGGTRSFAWATTSDLDAPYDLVIRAYMDPEMWLARRGLLRKAEVNYPVSLYRLTPAGLQRAWSMKDSPL